ncbi:hypothetical protein BD410DRAFT_716722 [Rickenella mellea]|uniref:Tail specific protease domain-containing protein n=1 Tax=Rickenella mellea TaxID=50990 RepID=A0A4Y7QGC7_9AGAM|nr:hypothetical protein BD410DRAFT_716722 [Rickenella mellea]
MTSPDPCTGIGTKLGMWSSPSDVRTCFKSIPFNATIRSNIVEVITKTLAFHTSVNYQILAPEPFTQDVHEDILADLARIDKQEYPTDLDLHIDISRTVKKLQDSHCRYINFCYDSLFGTYFPLPLTLLTDSNGEQAIHISPDAFLVISNAFADQIPIWQNALPGDLKGKLATLSGAKVLAINGQDPWAAVNANAEVTGGFQGFGTRQNVFFSSYSLSSGIWEYSLGDFALQTLPINDHATLTVIRVNGTKPETFSLPYRSRMESGGEFLFTDTASFIENNCVAMIDTNGFDANADGDRLNSLPSRRISPTPSMTPAQLKKVPMSVMLTDTPQGIVILPPGLTPPNPIASDGSASFYMLSDGKTGVLAIGAFDQFGGFLGSLLNGLQSLNAKGATQLIVDVTNNGGGGICTAEWLHRIIAGPKQTTVPQAGFNTKTRAGPLARMIVQKISEGADPGDNLMYNPLNYKFANNTPFPAEFNWLEKVENITINGRADAFSQFLGQECQPFDLPAPDTPLFDTSKVAIVTNGFCASSCALFAVTMAKEEGSKSVVFGGKKDVTQQYCGTVGGESSDFGSMDTEVKTTGLKNSSLAPPDLLTNSVQGLTWRLAFGVQDPTQPEEWQNHQADVNFPLKAETVNNPIALWSAIAAKVLG